MRKFRWNAWNLDHATAHGCQIEEIESVVRHPGRGFPQKVGGDKLMVEGRGTGGRMIHVVYVLDEDGSYYVIHAMPLTTRRRRSQ
jgi:hypothetical protein